MMSSSSKSFEERWPILWTLLDTLIHKIQGLDNSSFACNHLMSSSSVIVYELCTAPNSDKNAKLLYNYTKKAVEDYINSKVVPCLRGKKDEDLLRELLRRWSNHRTITKWISRIFNYPERYLHKLGIPSIEYTSFISFYDLVFDEMNKQVIDAILFMIGQELAGQQIDRTLVNYTLGIYYEIGYVSRRNHAETMIIGDKAQFYHDKASNWIPSSSSQDNTPKVEKSLHEKSLVLASKKTIKLESCDGVVYEIGHNVALMSPTIVDIINANPKIDDGNSVKIALPYVNSRILRMIIEYCKKHTEYDASSSSDDKYHHIIISDDDDDVVVDWDDDHMTLFDLNIASNYLNIKGLVDLSSNKVAEMMKGKSPCEIRNMFNIK